jgi:hypothetical protein
MQVDPADIPTMDDFVRQHADLRKISKIGWVPCEWMSINQPSLSLELYSMQGLTRAEQLFVMGHLFDGDGYLLMTCNVVIVHGRALHEQGGHLWRGIQVWQVSVVCDQPYRAEPHSTYHAPH